MKIPGYPGYSPDYSPDRLYGLAIFTGSSFSQYSSQPKAIAARGDLATDEMAIIDIFNQASPSGAYAGVGFAVPVDTVNRIAPQLISRGEYVTPSLGITVDDDINQKSSNRFGFRIVLILDIAPGSATERAGLRLSRITSAGSLVPGDLILSPDGDEVESVAELLGVLNCRSVGGQVTVRIWLINS